MKQRRRGRLWLLLVTLSLSAGVGLNNFAVAWAATPDPNHPPTSAAPTPQTPPPAPLISVKYRDSGQTLPSLRLQSGGDLLTVRHDDDTGVHTLQVPVGREPAQVAQELNQDPNVEWAEPVRWRHLEDPGTSLPNDPNYVAAQQWYFDALNLPAAWAVEAGRPSVVVAVVDSGVMCTHPDLAPNMWHNPDPAAPDVYGYDFVGTDPGNPALSPTPGRPDPCVKAGDPSDGNGLDDDGDGVPDAGVTHGTMVAGIIAAASNNGVGVTGTCWGCKIMAVRVANPEGWTLSSEVADGITYAAKHGAKVINLSFGGPDLSSAERAAINLAINTYGAVVVAAAGNENTHPISYPAQLSNVIAVGASAHANIKGRASFTNWGTGGANDRPVDVVAPGVDIASTGIISVADARHGEGPAGSAVYKKGAGTSFSAPLISGVAGLLLSKNPSLSPQQIVTILRSTAIPLPDDLTVRPAAGPLWAGAGIINAAAALAAAGTTPPAKLQPAPGSSLTPPPPSAWVNSIPAQLLTPAQGASLTSLGVTLTWNLPAGATQYQLQVIPAKGDGPGINLIRNVDSGFTVEAPAMGSGPYVMLPDMTYTWRVRTTAATSAVDEASAQWGVWSDSFTFHTRTATSGSIGPVSPADGSNAVSLTPTLQWRDADSAIFYYEVQLSADPLFGMFGAVAPVYWELRHGGVTNPADSYQVSGQYPLRAGMIYYWRVRPRIQGDGKPAEWSTSWSFATPTS